MDTRATRQPAHSSTRCAPRAGVGTSTKGSVMTSEYPGQQGPAQPGVSLNKLTLTKSAPSVSLSKQGSVGGRLRVNLNWNARPAGAGGGGGFFKKLMSGGAGGAIDLDL